MVKVRNGVLGAIAVVSICGCGASTNQRLAGLGRPHSHASAGWIQRGRASGRPLISFRRVFGTDPLASTLTVYPDGEAVATLGFGGKNGLQVHRFQMPAAQLQRLQTLVRRTRLHTTDAADVGHYIYWVITERGSYRLRDRLIPRTARPLFVELNTITDKRTGW